MSGDESYYSNNHVPNGSSNYHRAHEQLWFDGNSMKMLDFFADDIRSDDGYNRNDYDFFGPVYDDNLMHQALDNIRGDGITTHIVLCAEIVRILQTH
ncbi:hypothetical protein [Photobacterium sp. 1_MG-2023]|uniref:hypothetical protein n=1 Tax=Photobacterium sp. 1_MG-2023 TaxID=3062646 RepID=UPI0026E24ECD|nr:hypothetical protein [Photobacterium sp. 1_MG-2023]MDO6705963.1 hypothetical protein [Photobacterium sp. 1_MG-2023]